MKLSISSRVVGQTIRERSYIFSKKVVGAMEKNNTEKEGSVDWRLGQFATLNRAGREGLTEWVVAKQSLEGDERAL